MPKSRIKINLPQIATRDEAEGVMNDLAVAENTRRKFIARRDADVLAVNAKYENAIGACAETVRAKSEMLRAWAEATPEAFAKGRKSIDLGSGTLGFRTGTPKLALLSRAWDWNKVLAALRACGLKNFIRTKDEVDKEAIIAAAVAAGGVGIPGVGVKVVQEESFFVEPSLTDTDARKIEEVK